MRNPVFGLGLSLIALTVDPAVSAAHTHSIDLSGGEAIEIRCDGRFLGGRRPNATMIEAKCWRTRDGHEPDLPNDTPDEADDVTKVVPLKGGETLEVSCDGRSLAVTRSSRTSAVAKCRPRPTKTPTKKPTKTRTPTKTATKERPTDTPVVDPTDTPVPDTHTPLPTDTAIPPTSTPTDTPEPPTLTPTETAVPPTETPTQVATPSLTPTPTQTFTPAAPACGSATAPQCDGVCAAGTACVFSANACRCLPNIGPCGQFVGAPQCWGECPPSAPVCAIGSDGLCFCRP